VGDSKGSLLLTIHYTKGGQTFSMEGHIENFFAVGGPHIYFVCLSYSFQRMNI